MMGKGFSEELLCFCLRTETFLKCEVEDVWNT